MLQRDGDAVWAVLDGGGKPADERQAQVVNLLRVAKELDRLGDVLAEWAVDITRDRPNDEVDDVIDEIGAQLDALGVPHEERPPNRRARRLTGARSSARAQDHLGVAEQRDRAAGRSRW